MKLLIFYAHIFLCLLLIGRTVQANNSLDSIDYSESAKNRTYVGGSEESDLKIVPESYFQKNKKNSIEEINEGF